MKNNYTRKSFLIALVIIVCIIFGGYKFIRYQNRISIEEYFSANKTDLNIIVSYLDTHKYSGISYEDVNLVKYTYVDWSDAIINDVVCSEIRCTWEEKIVVESLKRAKASAFVVYAKYIEILDLDNVAISDKEIFMYKKWFFKEKKVWDKLDRNRYTRVKKILDND